MHRRPFALELLSFLGLAGCWLLLLPPAAWYPVYQRLGDSRWWLFVVNSGALYLFAPVPVVLLLALLLRRWGLALAALVPAAIAVMVFGELFVPVSAKLSAQLPVPLSALSPQTPRLSVMTFNLHAWNTDVAAIGAAFRASGADLVAVQELNYDVGVALASDLAAEFPYHSLVLRRDWTGLGLYSRYPLTPAPADLGSGNVVNPQVVTAHLPWGDTTVVNVHNLSIPRTLPDWPSEITNAVRYRERVAAGIVELARRRSQPVIVLGDFNTTERSTAYDLVAAELHDAWLAAGFGFGHTFPGGPYSPTPFGFRSPSWLLRIDYVFFSRELNALDARFGPWDGRSDHRPVLVELARFAAP